ncbi:MAG: DUF2935 domain-containing protein [Solirubrobacterales bacterium]
MPQLLSASEFVRHSLDLNLFFLRIMKEHAYFMEANFVPKNADLAKEADGYKNLFDGYLKEAVRLANGNISAGVIDSMEAVTDLTARAEEKSMELSGIPIDIELTRSERRLRPGQGNPALENEVYDLNEKIIEATCDLIDFKTHVLNEQLAGELYIHLFSDLLEHIRSEARHYVQHLQRLQRRVSYDPDKELIESKVFWDHIMGDHAEFIEHLLDPTEKALIKKADEFSELFDGLERRAVRAEQNGANGRGLRELVRDEIRATRQIREFKRQGEIGVLSLEIRSLIDPLLADHVFREASHFLRILEMES